MRALMTCVLLLLLAVPPFAVAQDDTGDAHGDHDEHAAEQCDATDTPRQWPAAIEADQQFLSTLPPPDDNAALRLIAQRLGDSGAGDEDTYSAQWSWAWRWEKKDIDTPALKLSWLDDLRLFLRQVSLWLGIAGHVLLWLLLGILLLLLWKYRAQFIALWPRARDDARLVAGIDIAPLLRPDALPDDVVAGAEHLWRAGHPREALSLLYRAALHRLGLRLDFAIPESGTEQECLALVARHADRPTTDAFRALVNGWMRMAWQHRAPADVAPLVDAYRRAASGADAAAHPAHARQRPAGAP